MPRVKKVEEPVKNTRAKKTEEVKKVEPAKARKPKVVEEPPKVRKPRAKKVEVIEEPPKVRKPREKKVETPVVDEKPYIVETDGEMSVNLHSDVLIKAVQDLTKDFEDSLTEENRIWIAISSVLHVMGRSYGLKHADFKHTEINRNKISMKIEFNKMIHQFIPEMYIKCAFRKQGYEPTLTKFDDSVVEFTIEKL